MNKVRTLEILLSCQNLESLFDKLKEDNCQHYATLITVRMRKEIPRAVKIIAHWIYCLFYKKEPDIKSSIDVPQLLEIIYILAYYGNDLSKNKFSELMENSTQISFIEIENSTQISFIENGQRITSETYDALYKKAQLAITDINKKYSPENINKLIILNDLLKIYKDMYLYNGFYTGFSFGSAGDLLGYLFKLGDIMDIKLCRDYWYKPGYIYNDMHIEVGNALFNQLSSSSSSSFSFSFTKSPQRIESTKLRKNENGVAEKILIDCKKISYLIHTDLIRYSVTKNEENKQINEFLDQEKALSPRHEVYSDAQYKLICEKIRLSAKYAVENKIIEMLDCILQNSSGNCWEHSILAKTILDLYIATKYPHTGIKTYIMTSTMGHYFVMVSIENDIDDISNSTTNIIVDSWDNGKAMWEKEFILQNKSIYTTRYRKPDYKYVGNPLLTWVCSSQMHYIKADAIFNKHKIPEKIQASSPGFYERYCTMPKCSEEEIISFLEFIQILFETSHEKPKVIFVLLDFLKEKINRDSLTKFEIIEIFYNVMAFFSYCRSIRNNTSREINFSVKEYSALVKSINNIGINGKIFNFENSTPEIRLEKYKKIFMQSDDEVISAAKIKMNQEWLINIFGDHANGLWPWKIKPEEFLRVDRESLSNVEILAITMNLHTCCYSN